MMVAVDSGGDPARAARDRKEAPTFAEVAEEWLAYRKADPNHNAHFLGDDSGMLKRHINPVLGHLSIKDIRKTDILHLIRLMRTKTHARKYKDKKPRPLTTRINRVYQRARAVMRWALAEGIVTTDPCGGIRKPILIEQPRNVVLNETQLKAFWGNLSETPMAPATRIALKLSLVTGQRIGAVASIGTADVNLSDECPHWIIPRLRKGAVAPLEGT